MYMVQTYGSGTMTVQDVEPGKPWLHVYAPSTYGDRYKVCEDLRDFLNGGPRPPWLADMTRISPVEAEDVDRTSITAAGEMFPWEDRVLLMDRIFPSQSVS